MKLMNVMQYQQLIMLVVTVGLKGPRMSDFWSIVDQIGTKWGKSLTFSYQISVIFAWQDECTEI